MRDHGYKLQGQTDTGLANWDVGFACNSGGGTRRHPSRYKPSTAVNNAFGEILALPPRGPAGLGASAPDWKCKGGFIAGLLRLESRRRERAIKRGRTCQSATLCEIERKDAPEMQTAISCTTELSVWTFEEKWPNNKKVWMQNLRIKRWVGTGDPSGPHWGTSNRQSAEQGRVDADCHGPVGRTRRRESRGTLTLEGQQWSVDGSQIPTGDLGFYLGDHTAPSPSQMDEVTGSENESDSEDDQSQTELVMRSTGSSWSSQQTNTNVLNAQ